MDTRFADAQRDSLHHLGVTADHREVPSDVLGATAHAIVTGEGPPIVLVCGIGLPAAFWAPLMAEMKGLRLYAIEMPGFGSTPHSPAFTDDDYRTHAVGYLLEVCSGLGLDGPLTLMTNSLGSLWANWLALDRPERLRAAIHVGCPALVLDTTAPLPMRVLSTNVVGAAAARIPPSLRQVESLGRTVGEDLTRHPVMRDLLLATERLDHRTSALRHTLRAVLRNGRTRADAQVGVDELARIEVPTQLIWGDRDPFGSVDIARRIDAALPNSELHVVPGGHAPWLDSAPDVGRHARSFLAAHAS